VILIVLLFFSIWTLISSFSGGEDSIDKEFIDFGSEVTRKISEHLNSNEIQNRLQLSTTMAKLIKAQYPDQDVFLQSDSLRLVDAPTWIINPISNEENYLKNVPYAIEIAYIIDKEVRYAIVFFPIEQQLFTAIKTKGAYTNGAHITVSQKKTLENAYVATNDENLKQNQYSLHLSKWRSPEVEQCALAKGVIDLYVEKKGKLSVTSPIRLIVEEAGATIYEGQTSLCIGNADLVQNCVNGI